MKIASFNVNSLRVRLPIVVQWLKDHEVDVLCVQETKVQDVDFPAEAFDEIGYNQAFKGQKTYNGVAVFSKHPIENIVFGFADEPTDETRLIRAQIDGVIIVNSYVPQGYSTDSEKFQYKLRWFERLLDYFRQNFNPEDAVLWVGDLNIAPEPIDVYDPDALAGHVCFHTDVRAALKKVMAWGFVDVFRKHCTEAGQYTFWDYRMRNPLVRNQGWRIDHLMATVPLAEKCIACYIDTEPRRAKRPSDHTPVVAEFDIP
ncbi:MAG: exodeoxyribonuclease III [Phycisphaerales bacterium]|nr:MAG: exodeoxyribonuclease III [Phycisphaerales bacterium]UCF15864.1 MAG: exodeoxyribonuclease III [Phycisphaerales bacterium]